MFKKYKNRGFDSLSSLSLILMVFLSAYSLESTRWTENLNLVTSLACIGVILGLALGVSSFRKKQLILISALYSLVILFLFLVVIPTQKSYWVESWSVILERVHLAGGALLHGEPVPDNILFILITGSMYWVISLWAGIDLIRKKNPWIPLGILSVSLIVTQFFQLTAYRSALLSGVFFFLFLFLAGRLRYLEVHQAWKEQRAYEDQESAVVFLRTILLFSIFLVILAWGIPYILDVATPGTKQHKAFVQNMEDSGDFFSDFFSSFRAQPIQKETVFGDTFQLGSSQPLGDDVLFTAIAPSDDFINGNYYWKARSYSNYENGEWSSIDVEGQSIESDTVVQFSDMEQYEVGKFIFVVNAELNYYYLPGITVSINRPARITEIFKDTKDYDVLAWKPFLPLEENDSYQSESYFLPLTYETLAEAGGSYPARVKNIYLQLPENFSSRFRQLARAITNGLDSDFEKTMAITNYLRSQMTYTTQIDEISQNLDPVFWFLFDVKSGYCNYYASSEVLLLRSIGIPARLAAGYAQGVEIERNKVFEVRSKDSHVWVEVYFPDVGWVIFEPTSAQPAVYFPSETAMMEENESVENGQQDWMGQIAPGDLPTNANNSSRYEAIERRLAEQGEGMYSFGGTGEPSSDWLLPGVIAFCAAGLILFLFFGKIKFQGRTVALQAYLVLALEKSGKIPPRWMKTWADYRAMSCLQHGFFQFDQYLKAFGVGETPQKTPLEKASFLQKFVPNAADEIENILRKYQEEIYGGRIAEEHDLRKQFRKLRKEVFLALLVYKFTLLWKKLPHR